MSFRKWIAGGYAGHYGRASHLLARGAEVLDEPPRRQLANQLGSEAMASLCVEQAGVFRSDPARDACDAIDEPGTLLPASVAAPRRPVWPAGSAGKCEHLH